MTRTEIIEAVLSHLIENNPEINDSLAVSIAHDCAEVWGER